MQKWIIKHKTVLVIYAVLSFVLILPQLSIKYPSLIDDGTDMLDVRSNSVVTLLKREIIESSRTRPIHILYRKLLYSLFEDKVEYHYLTNGIVVFVTAVFTFVILRELDVNFIYAYLAGLTLFIMPSVPANMYRLGTIEHLQAIFLLLGVLLILKRQHIASLIILFLACFIKETSIFYLLIPIFYFKFWYKEKKLLLFSSGLFAFVALVLSIKQLWMSDNYTNQLSFSFDHIVTASQLSPMIFGILFVGILVWRVGNSIEHKLIFFTFLLSFLPFFIWGMTVYYYYLFVQIMSIIVLFSFSNQLLLRFQVGRKLSNATTIVLVALMVLSNAPSFANVSESLHYQALAEGSLVQYLLTHDWTNYRVYSGISHYERNHKISVYISSWNHNVHNVTIIPTMKEWFAKPFADDAYRKHLAQESTDAFFRDSYRPRLLIAGNLGNTVVNSGYSTRQICGSSPFIHSACEYTVIEDR